MVLAVTHQALGSLFRRHDANVRDEAAMDGVRIVEVDGLPDEVGAIVKQKIEAPLVGPGIESLNKPVVLLRRGFDAKGVDSPVVRGAHQLYPISPRCLASRRVRRHSFKVPASISVPKSRHSLCIHGGRNVTLPVHAIKVREQRNRDPIVAGDPVIATDHHSLLSGIAAAQRTWRSRTNARNIDLRVTSGIHPTEGSKWLLQQDCDAGTRRSRAECEQPYQYQRPFAHSHLLPNK